MTDSNINASQSRKSYHLLDEDVKDPFGHTYYGLPKGVRDSAKDNEVSPDVANIPDLLPGETIAAQFDVYFPGKPIPRWLYIFLTVSTMGLFLVFMQIKMWFMKQGCCLPTNQEFDRGRLLITTKGRVLTWKANFNQVIKLRPCAWLLRMCLGPDPAKYEGFTQTGSYMLSDIAEVVYDTVKSPSFLCGACCCTEGFQGAIRVYFNRFDTHNTAASSLKCASINKYEKKSNHIFGGILSFDEGGAGVMGFLSNLVAGDTSFIEITSYKESDVIYDYENRTSDASFSNLADLYKMLNRAVCQTRQVSAWTPPTGACAGGLLTATPVDSPWGSLDTVEENKVDLPIKYAGLCEGETVVAAQTNMYIMTMMDRILSVLTLGIYYVVSVSEKRKCRPSFVLTTKRLMEVTPYSEDGCLSTLCPPSLLSVCLPVNRGMTIRSLYPKTVFSGYLRRVGFHIDCSLCTDCGSIDLSFDQIKRGVEDLSNETRYARKMRFCHALMSTATRATEFKSGESAFLEPTKQETECFPLASEESVMARYSGSVPDAVCADLLPGLCNVERTYHPGVCMAATCGLTPMFAKSSITLTTSSVFTYKEKTNYPFSCWSILLPFLKRHDWELMWTPLNHFVSVAVNTSLVGNDNCLTRTCNGTFLGKNCCPLTKSILAVTVDAKTNPLADGTLRGTASNVNPFKPLRIAPELKEFREAMARVQANLIDNNPALSGVSLPSGGVEATVSPILSQPPKDATATAVDASFSPPKTTKKSPSNDSEGSKF